MRYGKMFMTYTMMEKISHVYLRFKPRYGNSSKDLHGKPTNRKPRKGKPRGYQASQDNSHEQAAISSFLQIDKDQLGTWALFTTPHNYKWIVSSGASDHMTFDSKLFSTYIPCVGHEKINTASGSSSAIAGKGSVLISKNLQLDYVQHVLT
ncbi:hypothetical protein L6164_001188 [Bauhinia variegata]|uniref:Uncharacterized protein n=1 Tax=Bauhinia variegata TaxID=167791 RepID=A0ACB9QBI0_BAUVA|nr:hypothetical protein L6164_001188 [Bauhinia variegata]